MIPDDQADAGISVTLHAPCCPEFLIFLRLDPGWLAGAPVEYDCDSGLRLGLVITFF